MQDDWSSGRTLIHRILSWISFFNRFKHTNLGFSHWALEELHSIGFFDRSTTCKLFFIFLFGDWALATWYLLLPIGGVEMHLYYCASTEKIFWTLKRVQISVKKMIFDDNIIQIIFKKKLYASNPRSQGPFYFELSWSGERTLGTRLYASKNGHRWLAKYLNLDRLQEKLLQTWWKMTSKQRKISLFSSTSSWGCCLATQRSSQRCLGYALDLFWTVPLAARSIEVSCKAFATLLIS